RAVEHRLLAVNPAAAVRPPRPTATEVQSLTAEEVEALLAVASDPEMHTLIFLAANTGARIGELMALQWDDLVGDRLRIRRNAVYLPGEGVNFGPPKTRASRRQIRLSAECVAALSEHRVRQLERRLLLGAAYQDRDLIFSGPLGRVQAPKVVSRRFSAIVKRAVLKRCTFHTLRHTCATLGLIEGVNVKVMQERLGHGSSAITLDLYSHTTEDMQAEAAELIGAQIRRTRAE
ncbi:MAG: site-specific integrase, partial [Chloroflexi bacterium]|nr:site-specific integrase [Chloroflexota bacterium]